MAEPSQDAFGRFSSPFSGYSASITSRYGKRARPGGFGSKNHKGVDLSVGPGVSGYPTQAIEGGYVTHAGRARGYGNMVEIAHENGFKSRYAHLEGVNVQRGQYIARGTPVGLVGSTGKSTGPHLHLEVIDPKGRKVNPQAFVDFTTNIPTPTPRPGPVTPPSPPESLLAAFSPQAQAAPSVPALEAIASLVGRPEFSAPLSLAPSPNIDPARLAGFSNAIDPARFGGPMASIAEQVSLTERAAPPAPSPERFGYTPEIDAARFGGPPSISIASPASPVGQMAAAVAPGPAFSAPSPERFGYTAEIDPSRFGGPSMPDISTPVSPVGEYASVVGAPDQQISQGWAGNLLGVPSTAVPTTAIDPASVPSNMLEMSYTPPEINMGVPNSFQPQQTAMLPAPSMPVALPAQPQNVPAALPAVPTAVPTNIPAAIPAAVPAAVPPMTPAGLDFTPTSAVPSLSVRDVYGGAVGSAVANDGSIVSRDDAGNTTVTNKFGATTATTPTGQQAAYWGGAKPGPVGPTSLFGGAMPGPSRSMVGSVIGGLAGSAIAGPVGGLIGALAGNVIATNAFGGTGSNSFPAAPSRAGETRGPALSQRDRDSISPAASRSMDRNGGRMTGLW